MVTIQVANLMSRIVGVYDGNIHKLLDRQLSYQVEGVEFIPAVQNGRYCTSLQYKNIYFFYRFII